MCGAMKPKQTTLGDALCNFRFKKGRQVTQDWSTQVPKIKQRFPG